MNSLRRLGARQAPPQPQVGRRAILAAPAALAPLTVLPSASAAIPDPAPVPIDYEALRNHILSTQHCVLRDLNEMEGPSACCRKPSPATSKAAIS